MGAEHENLRNDARQAFAAAGLTYDVLTPANMQRLRTLVNDSMKVSGLIMGAFRCRQRAIIKQTPWGPFAELRCRADYFDNREAISFNTDGFIGFAGWADDTNVRPILDGFKAWCAELVTAQSPALQHGAEEAG
jgi:hypothetical protein